MVKQQFNDDGQLGTTSSTEEPMSSLTFTRPQGSGERGPSSFPNEQHQHNGSSGTNATTSFSHLEGQQQQLEASSSLTVVTDRQPLNLSKNRASTLGSKERTSEMFGGGFSFSRGYGEMHEVRYLLRGLVGLQVELTLHLNSSPLAPQYQTTLWLP